MTNLSTLIKIILVCLLPVLTLAQQVISVRAGLINDIVGEVYLDGQRVKFPSDQPNEVTDGTRLRTESGLAEIQLGAGAFLYVNQKTQFRMEDSGLENILLCLEHGSILIEIVELYANNNITVLYRDMRIQFPREGLYRLDANRPRLRVYGGEATVLHPDRKVERKKKKCCGSSILKEVEIRPKNQ